MRVLRPLGKRHELPFDLVREDREGGAAALLPPLRSCAGTFRPHTREELK